MNRYDGFHEFVVARGGALSRTAFLLTGEHHAAEDLVQSALAKAATRWRQIMEYGQPEAYVRRTMINEQISWWRRRPAWPVADLPDLPGPDEPHRIVDRVALGQALGTLTPRQRAVLVLRFYEDLSEADTAATMGCSIGTVKSQTHLALSHLRRALPLFAEESGQYADAAQAMAKARQRRTRRVAAVAALALVPLALATVLYALRGGSPVPPPVLSTPSPGPSATSALAPLPPSLAGISDDIQDLPKDRAVGPVSLLVVEAATPEVQTAELIAADGRRYRLSVPDDDFGVSFLLSPDGRWLAWTIREATIVRDLTGTAEHRLPGSRQVLWSPGTRWLYSQVPGGRDSYVELAGWTVHEAPATTPPTYPVAVLDDGHALAYDGPRTAARTPLKVFDPMTGAVRTRFAVDAAPWLRAGETTIAVTTPEQEQVVVVMVGTGDVGTVSVVQQRREVALLEFSLADGRVQERLDLVGHGALGTDVVWPMCFRGGEMLWHDGVAVRVAGDEPIHRAVFTIDHRHDAYQLPGCLRTAYWR
ncbi:hypothetical protein GCM10028775_20740 [Catellatospora paridis]